MNPCDLFTFRKRSPDWIIEAKCPQKEGMTLQETVRTCTGCPYKILEFPVSDAGVNKAMCSITLGKLAQDLDSITFKIAGIKEFTEQKLSPVQRIESLKQIKEYAKEKRWSFAGLSLTQTIDKLDMLIDFCKRAEAKRLNILAVR
jgi:hypothetical protein